MILAQIGQTLEDWCGRIDHVHVQPWDIPEAFTTLAARFSHLEGTVALLSGGDLDCARFHMLGIWPWLCLAARKSGVQLIANDRLLELAEDPFAVLAAVVDYFALPPSGEPPMRAGLMGYLSYDLKDCLEKLPRTSVDELGLPLLRLYAPALVVVQERRTGSARLMVPRRQGGPEPALLIERFEQALRGPAPPSPGFAVDGAAMTSNFSRAEYHRAIVRILEYIAAGDIYQANMTQRFEAPFAGDAFALFRHLYARNPAPFYAFAQRAECARHRCRAHHRRSAPASPHQPQRLLPRPSSAEKQV